MESGYPVIGIGKHLCGAASGNHNRTYYKSYVCRPLKPGIFSLPAL